MIPAEGRSGAGTAENSKEQYGLGSEKFCKQNGVQRETGALPFNCDISCLLKSCLQAVMIPALRWSKTHPSGLTAVWRAFPTALGCPGVKNPICLSWGGHVEAAELEKGPVLLCYGGLPALFFSI